jgi:hypothetical protein
VILSDRFEYALERFAGKGIAAVVVMHDGQAAIRMGVDSRTGLHGSPKREAIPFKGEDQLTGGEIS